MEDRKTGQTVLKGTKEIELLNEIYEAGLEPG